MSLTPDLLVLVVIAIVPLLRQLDCGLVIGRTLDVLLVLAVVVLLVIIVVSIVQTF